MTATSAWLVLEDGTTFPARSVGADGERFGEAVFNTAMTGYQEILTDPSYKGQIVCMTYPHIGNYGVNEEDVESARPWVEGFVVRSLSPIVSNFRAQMSLEAYLRQHQIVAVDQVDTRALTLHLRREGAMKAGLSTVETDPGRLLKRVREAPSIVGVDLVREVTCKQPYEWPAGGTTPLATPARSGAAAAKYHIVVIDYGVKYGILRQLAGLGCYLSIVPATMPAREILARKPDGIVLSNGPGDPAAVTYAIATIRELMGSTPMLGICLGQQLLGLAFGGKTFKLKFGHHGANHPVQDLATGKVEITSQNHGFAVDLDSIPQQQAELTHVNLNDRTVEGMRHRTLPIFSLQYHPEASPGPHDAQYVFARFIEAVERAAKAR
ncbi:MAG: glutamine-hydrolyzing carbamoyl-phosphate synthase small subunit [Candidatus Omnitrophica bacterium]|nr:glutamine-hydrolyzing carbamoyl-phosphate synthase small subunit [Candidatus Omnitrophota bacterium]